MEKANKHENRKDAKVQFQNEDILSDILPTKSLEFEEDGEEAAALLEEDLELEGFVAPDDNDYDYNVDYEDYDDKDVEDSFGEDNEGGSQKRTIFRMPPNARRISVLPFSASFFHFDLEQLSYSSSLSTSSELFETVGATSEPLDESFLENFGELPHVADITASETSLNKQSTREVDTAANIATDAHGHFVDPLTGKAITSTPTTSQARRSTFAGGELESSLEEAAGEDDASAAESENELCFVYRDSLSLTEIDKMYSMEDLAAGAAGMQMAAEQELNTILEAAVRITSTPQMAERIEEVPRVSTFDNEVTVFLDNILNAVFKRYEEEQNRQSMSEKLDKKALCKQLMALSQEYFFNQKISQFLERKAVEHFRRKGSERQKYTEDKREEADDRDLERYTEMRDHLNKVMGAEVAATRKSEEKIEELEMEVEREERNVEQEVQNFEALVRKLLKRDEMPHLEREVERGLKQVRELRAEISQVRSVVIQRQHTLGRLTTKIERVQDLGEGFSLTDYEHLNTQVRELEKKYDERIGDLAKSHHSFQHNVHALSHMKLKSKMMYNQMQNNLAIYNANLNEKRWCRNQLFKLNTKKVKICKQLSDMRMRLGLMDKPDLLRDFDETANLLVQKRKTISELRKTLGELETKIKKYSDRMLDSSKNEKAASDARKQGFFVKGVQIGK